MCMYSGSGIGTEVWYAARSYAHRVWDHWPCVTPSTLVMEDMRWWESCLLVIAQARDKTEISRVTV